MATHGTLMGDVCKGRWGTCAKDADGGRVQDNAGYARLHEHWIKHKYTLR
jgi:hypothetical protein